MDATFPVAPPRADVPADYVDTLADIKQRISAQRLRVVTAANVAMVELYWEIGRTILDRQSHAGWGAKIIDRLSEDLRAAYPDMRGFSPRNLKYMRALAAAWSDPVIVQRVVAQLPWGHNVTLLDRLSDLETRTWYARCALEQGWSRDILTLQIENRAHERHGKTISTFAKTLPPADSDMAEQVFKDPYLFDFLGTADPRREREVEQALVDHIQRFLLELGTGFAFVGRRVHLEVGRQDFYLDLLFYHLKLRCFVVIELKSVEFDPASVGQLNLYLSATDDLLRHPDDKPTIGLLLCRSKNKLVVEYALRDIDKPIGVAQWATRLVETLPSDLEGSLPTVEQLEAELGDGEQERGEHSLGRTPPARSTAGPTPVKRRSRSGR
ncbi:MAG TPA: PDDEXK nuclease domain-containing protein [Kofleriaceae bacterium]|nr:PDDEXK nuclease domain-containing protein [Kofleriaceae bacterium]